MNSKSTPQPSTSLGTGPWPLAGSMPRQVTLDLDQHRRLTTGGNGREQALASLTEEHVSKPRPAQGTEPLGTQVTGDLGPKTKTKPKIEMRGFLSIRIYLSNVDFCGMDWIPSFVPLLGYL